MSRVATVVVGTYWIVWAVDDRPTFRRGKHRHCRYYNGVARPVDPKKRMAFSYVCWTQPFAGRPWDYNRKHAQRWPTPKAARLARRLCWEMGWGRAGGGKSMREALIITRVTRVRRGALRTPHDRGTGQ